MFLSLNKTNEAKAIIQQLKDPYLKFASIIQLSRSLNNGISREYYDRMQKYIDEKIYIPGTDKRDSNYEKLRRASILARLKLKSEMLRFSNFPIKESDIYSEINTGLTNHEVNSGMISCSINANQDYFDAIVDLSDISFLKMDEVRTKRKIFHENNLIAMSMRNKLFLDFFDTCAQRTDKGKFSINTYVDPFKEKIMKNSLWDYSKAFRIYYQISFYDYKEGKKFLKNAESSNYDSEQMMSYYFDFQKKQPDMEMKQFANPYIYNKFFIFKKDVQNGNMCQAIDLLFKEFKGTPNYSRAISYLIESPDVNRNKKYDCGDESLELLLS